jgi:hypothetical protein
MMDQCKRIEGIFSVYSSFAHQGDIRRWLKPPAAIKKPALRV